MKIFNQVPKILLGKNTLERLPELLPEKKTDQDYYALIIDQVHKNTGLLERLPYQNDDLFIWCNCDREPTTSQIDKHKEEILNSKKRNPLAIIGIGGGSAMDISKAVSVTLTNPGPASTYQGWDLVSNPAIFKVGIPTLSGTGAEASGTAVLSGPEKKLGINSPYSMFDAFISDPATLKTVPKEQTFFTAMDCYIHDIESLNGKMKTPLSETYASKSLELCREFFENPDYKTELMTASYLGGAAIVNSETGICHALSYGLSQKLGYRHGLANCLLFNVLEEFYGPSVKEMHKLLENWEISLPQGVSANLKPDVIDELVNIALRMERPLMNALGPNWKEILPPEKIRELYERI